MIYGASQSIQDENSSGLVTASGANVYLERHTAYLSRGLHSAHAPLGQISRIPFNPTTSSHCCGINSPSQRVYLNRNRTLSLVNFGSSRLQDLHLAGISPAEFPVAATTA